MGNPTKPSIAARDTGRARVCGGLVSLYLFPHQPRDSFVKVTLFVKLVERPKN